MRERPIPFSLPWISKDEIREVVRTLKSEWLTTGPKTKRFEELFRNAIQCRHAIAVNSCTAALHLSLKAAGIKAGDEVITSTNTFVATAEVIIHTNAKPVLVDIQRDTFNLDPEAVETAIGPKTRAIIPVHFGGHPSDMDEILRIAKKHRLWIFEDAAHALGAEYHGARIGTIGDTTSFSFYATKNLTTGEGGMITTDNGELAERMALLSLHGISKDAWKRYSAEGRWFYEVLLPGFKYNMMDIQAAIGIHQLEKFEMFQKKREVLVALYNEGFKDVEEILKPSVKMGCRHAWHLYVICLDLDRLRISREAFIQELHDRNIGTSVHFIPVHRHPYYRDTYRLSPVDFPNAEYVYERVVSLPLYPKLKTRDVERIIHEIVSVIKRHRR